MHWSLMTSRVDALHASHPQWQRTTRISRRSRWPQMSGSSQAALRLERGVSLTCDSCGRNGNGACKRLSKRGLVDLDVPLAGLLPLLELVLPDEALLVAHLLEHLGDARHHALEAAEVHVRAVVHAVEDLVGVLLDLVLDVHLAAVHVGLLTREGVVEAEVVRVRLENGLPLVIVQQRIGVRHAEEEPGQALVRLAVRRLLDEQAADEGAVRRDAGAVATMIRSTFGSFSG